MNVKLISFLLIAVLVVNLTLFAMKIISRTIFWVIMAAIGIIAYFVLPKLGHKQKIL